jgi:sarcosine oxidase, subunit beta
MQAEIVICGAGIAGISAAYHLSVKNGIDNIFLLDERPPLSLTSDKSTECYRNWWPDPSMIALMNHSIDLMEEIALQTRNVIHMNRRGYLYVTSNLDPISSLLVELKAISENGGGEIRYFAGDGKSTTYRPALVEGFEDQPSGADLITDKGIINKYFPYLTDQTQAVLHVRRAGWLSAHQLGTYLLDQSRLHGVNLLYARLESLHFQNGKIKAVQLSDGTIIETSHFINAAGPMFDQVGKMAGLNIPVFHELHQKSSFRDPLGIIPRNAPLLISMDPLILPWTDEERSYLLEESEANEFLLMELPSGAHLRPEGGPGSQIVLLLWDYQTKVIKPVFPPHLEELHAEVTLRGLTQLVPGLAAYIERRGRMVLDGGYYTRTIENRPLIGPTSVRGYYLMGAFSGYGIMSACAAGDLLARYLCERDLPGYASTFLLSRYDDPKYMGMIKTWRDQGQL